MAKTRSQRAVLRTNRKTPDALLDPLTGAQHSMSWEHHAIHEGFAFSASFTNDLPGGETKALEIRVPANMEMHLKGLRVWTTAGEVVVTFTENPTIGNPGTTPLPAVNRNRTGEHHDTGSVMKLFSDPANISEGKELFRVSIGAGGTGISPGAVTESEDREWPLGGRDEEAIYTLEFENQDTQERRLSYSLFWYELEEEEEA